MRSSTGRWVIGEDFFNRESELAILEARINDRNHIVLSGQRRMGKTSLIQELGRRLSLRGWIVLFVDVEDAACAEDAIADVAQATYQHRPLVSRVINGMKHWFTENVDELDIYSFRVKVRATLDSASWRRHGASLLRGCAEAEKPVLLVIDELPIFLKRMWQRDGDGKRVDEFLSWLRGSIQTIGENSPVLLLSGSIGLQPLVNRLGISDRVNYLDPFRLGPWDRETSIACIEALSDEYELEIEDGVGYAVYERLGIGIPHHVQSFFARLREHCIQLGRDVVQITDVDEVYRTRLLGASGQNDLVHYESRLNESLDNDAYALAMEILAEAALEASFTVDSELVLVEQYGGLMAGVESRISDVLDVLLHDGYLEEKNGEYRFPSNLLKDWWATRFRDHHIGLRTRDLRKSR